MNPCKVRIAIVGSRDCPCPEAVRSFVDGLDPHQVTVISGGAAGVDQIAEMAARRRNIEIVVYKANWAFYGPKAGPLRNQKVVDDADRLVAFWNGTSRGTLHAVAIACRKRIPVAVFGPDTREIPVAQALEAAAELGIRADPVVWQER